FSIPYGWSVLMAIPCWLCLRHWSLQRYSATPTAEHCHVPVFSLHRNCFANDQQPANSDRSTGRRSPIDARGAKFPAIGRLAGLPVPYRNCLPLRSARLLCQDCERKLALVWIGLVCNGLQTPCGWGPRSRV